MIREIVKIDESKCDGCGLCVPNCHEGALQVIDGKVRLISDLFCDGLGACLGHCPTGAITIEKREAEPYDEAVVMEKIIAGGPNVIKAHLAHLDEHGEVEFLTEAMRVLNSKNIPIPNFREPTHVQHDHGGGGCPGSRMIDRSNGPAKFSPVQQASGPITTESQLRQWPIQLALVNARAPYLKNCDLLLAADCAPFAYPNFHERFLKGKTLLIFCPKLDGDKRENYLQKLMEIFTNGNIRSLTVVHMEVPCCGGIEDIAREAMELCGKNITIKDYTIGLEGDIL